MMMNHLHIEDQRSHKALSPLFDQDRQNKSQAISIIHTHFLSSLLPSVSQHAAPPLNYQTNDQQRDIESGLDFVLYLLTNIDSTFVFEELTKDAPH